MCLAGRIILRELPSAKTREIALDLCRIWYSSVRGDTTLSRGVKAEAFKEEQQSRTSMTRPAVGVTLHNIARVGDIVNKLTRARSRYCPARNSKSMLAMCSRLFANSSNFVKSAQDGYRALSTCSLHKEARL